MKKWYLPLAVLGLGSMGVLLASDAGRKLLSRLSVALDDDAKQLTHWNEAAERELDNIQKAINSIAEMLGAREREAEVR